MKKGARDIDVPDRLRRVRTCGPFLDGPRLRILEDHAGGEPEPAEGPPPRKASLSEPRLSRTSIGMARTTVFEAVGPRPSIVWRVRSCMAPGLSAMVRAASDRLTAASLSPS